MFLTGAGVLDDIMDGLQMPCRDNRLNRIISSFKLYFKILHYYLSLLMSPKLLMSFITSEGKSEWLAFKLVMSKYQLSGKM